MNFFNPYYYAVKLRNWLYDRGILKSYSLNAPVVCVGNLSVGGSGKTSLVRFISEALSNKFHVAVLLRGYKRETKGLLVASYRGEVKASWEEVGDEAYMLSRILKNSSVLVCEDRYTGGNFAIKELGADLIILDDGFQHRRLRRNLDLVLLKDTDLRDRLLPFGRLREPLDALKRADAVVLSYQDIKEWNLRIEKPVFKLYRINWRVVSFDGRLVDYKDKTFVAFSGLGNNGQFFQTLVKLGIRVERFLSFPDHYHYRGFRLERGKLYLTTLKDFFKLEPSENLFYLDFDLRVDGLLEFIIKNIRAGSSAGRATDS
ncbi:tetraacyldisaccharide 4'-kinase [Thermocrinis sp.]|uniref:tetraacyldisaccharide 4'-kinase n=1 Tax=Thermocrinis sp. TaxID=2024383 RepID=UPI002FDE8A9A